MEYAIASIISLIIGVFLSYFILRSPRDNSSNLSKDIQHLLEIQRKDWEKGQLDLKSLVNPLTDNLKDLDKHIKEMETKREGAYKSLEKELENLGKHQKNLMDTTQDLENALRSSSSRGRWGELKLKNIVELAGLQKHVDYIEQVSSKGEDNTIRPDMVINLPNNGTIVIDSKAPLKAFLDSNQAPSEVEKIELLKKHSKSTRAFMRSLNQKSYWSQFDNSPELVVMFIPLESALYAAFENDKDLFDDALKNKILIVSAISLLGLLKSIHYGWMNVKLDENSKDIANEGKLLYERFYKFILMFQDIGMKLDRAKETYNKASSSMNSRVLPSMKRLKDMGAGSEDIESSEQLDVDSNTYEKEKI